MEQYCWNDIEEFFETLNQNCNYLILRNFEGIEKKEFLLDEHPDIDLLCDDPRKLKKLLRIVKHPGHIHHYDHYWVKIGCRFVEVGVRYVGDQYYDLEWERNMLSRRIFHSGGFYVMDSENYFYSLIYHAFYQKRKVSEDYQMRFADMGKALGVQVKTEMELLEALSRFLKKKGYAVTCPKDITIPMQFNRIPAELLWGMKEWKRRKVIYFPLRAVRAVSRRMLKVNG